MILSFDNYFVQLEQTASGTYAMTILKVNGPSKLDRQVIASTSINSIEALQESIRAYIPSANLLNRI